MESAAWMRQSNCVVGRKLTAPKRAKLVEKDGNSELVSRGRSSREYCPRNSFTTVGLKMLANCPTTVFVRSFSVPLFDSALMVFGNSALPVAFAFSALLRL